MFTEYHLLEGESPDWPGVPVDMHLNHLRQPAGSINPTNNNYWEDQNILARLSALREVNASKLQGLGMFGSTAFGSTASGLQNLFSEPLYAQGLDTDLGYSDIEFESIFAPSSVCSSAQMSSYAGSESMFSTENPNQSIGSQSIKMDPSLSLKNTPQHHPGHEYQGYTLPDEIPQSNYSDMSLFQGSMGINPQATMGEAQPHDNAKVGQFPATDQARKGKAVKAAKMRNQRQPSKKAQSTPYDKPSTISFVDSGRKLAESQAHTEFLAIVAFTGPLMLPNKALKETYIRLTDTYSAASNFHIDEVYNAFLHLPFGNQITSREIITYKTKIRKTLKLLQEVIIEWERLHFRSIFGELKTRAAILAVKDQILQFVAKSWGPNPPVLQNSSDTDQMPVPPACLVMLDAYEALSRIIWAGKTLGRAKPLSYLKGMGEHLIHLFNACTVYHLDYLLAVLEKTPKPVFDETYFIYYDQSERNLTALRQSSPAASAAVDLFLKFWGFHAFCRFAY